MGDIKPGDYVRITIEGPWYDDDYRTTEQIASIREYGAHPADTVTVEKIEPPVEVFKPGDRLRYKGRWSGYEITVADRGYLQHFTDGSVEFFTTPTKFTSEKYEFTSEKYEKVYPG